MKVLAIAALGVLALSGCSFTDENFAQLQPQLSDERITESTDATESALGALYTRASIFEEPAAGSEKWDAVILAGMDYVDESCGEYLNAVYLAHRNKDATPSFGSSFAALFGRPNVSSLAFAAAEDKTAKKKGAGDEAQEPLGLEAAFFHAANEDTRRTYRKKVFAKGKETKRREKFAALATLRGYANLCSAGKVEAQLAKAIASKPKS